MVTNTLYVPHDLIIQILLRLPVKSLIRFKCVRKSWLTLISNTHFANSHFEITSAHSRRILFISSPDFETRSMDLEASITDDSASTSPSLQFLCPQYYFRLRIICSCRGFIFLHRSTMIYLWNPSTRVHKQIPLSPIDSIYGVNYEYICYLYGFGYDQSRDDYLLVTMSCDRNLRYNLHGDYYSRLEFFSLRDNTWSEIEGTHFPYMNAFDYPMVGSLFNGAIHGLAFHLDLSMIVIVAFDLTERNFLEIYLPDDLEIYLPDDPEYEPLECNLWVFGECLSVWTMRDDIVEIWVMKEYNVHSSWTKTLVFSIDVIPTRCFSPACCTKSGDIIGRDLDNGLVKFDNKGQLLEHSSYFKGEHRESRVAMYTESLFSLPGNSEQG
ncbi:F-box only protein 8-like [Trifolium pratense]|uniref:F-box only protein 8-like n=1 Tax=Trifolium pratense TaxID=57577 RepID=UPI001E693F76|nr:F-box only protein 8-like [Trifolium pratense]